MEKEIFWNLLHIIGDHLPNTRDIRLNGCVPNGPISHAAHLSMALRIAAGTDPLDVATNHGVSDDQPMVSFPRIKHLSVGTSLGERIGKTKVRKHVDEQKHTHYICALSLHSWCVCSNPIEEVILNDCILSANIGLASITSGRTAINDSLVVFFVFLTLIRASRRLISWRIIFLVIVNDSLSTSMPIVLARKRVLFVLSLGGVSLSSVNICSTSPATFTSSAPSSTSTAPSTARRSASDVRAPSVHDVTPLMIESPHLMLHHLQHQR